MSIQSQIDRVSSNISESYTACSDMGATLPDEQVSDNLPVTIRSIPKGSDLDPQHIDMLIEGDFDPATFEVVSIKQNYAEVAEALRLKKDVRLLLNIPLGEDTVMTALGTVETFSPNEGMIEFGVIIDTTLSQDDGEQVYHFRITLWEDDSVSTERKVLSSDSSGGEAGRSIHYCTTALIHDSTDWFATPYSDSAFPYSALENIRPNDLCVDKIGGIFVVKGIMNVTSGEWYVQLTFLYQIKGDTPQKGTDYWTASDKQEIVTDVLNALPTWNGGSY